MRRHLLRSLRRATIAGIFFLHAPFIKSAGLGDINGDGRVSTVDAYLLARWEATGLEVFKPAPGSADFQPYFQCTVPYTYSSLLFHEALRRASVAPLPHFIEEWPQPTEAQGPRPDADSSVIVEILPLVLDQGSGDGDILIKVSSDFPIDFVSLVLRGEGIDLRPPHPPRQTNDSTFFTSTEFYLLTHGSLVFRPRLNIPLGLPGGRKESVFKLPFVVPRGTAPGDYPVKLVEGTEVVTSFGDAIIPVTKSGHISISKPILTGHDLPFPPLDFVEGQRAIRGKTEMRVTSAAGFPGDTVQVKVQLRTERPINVVKLLLNHDPRSLEISRVTPLFVDPEMRSVQESDYFITFIKPHPTVDTGDGLLFADYEPSFDHYNGIAYVPYDLGDSQPTLKYVVPLGEWIDWLQIEYKLLPGAKGRGDLTLRFLSDDPDSQSSLDFFPYLGPTHSIDAASRDCYGTAAWWQYEPTAYDSGTISVLGGGEPDPDPPPFVDPTIANTHMYLGDPDVDDNAIPIVANPGDVVRMPLYMRSEVRLWKLRFACSYDERVLELQNIEINYQDFDGRPKTVLLTVETRGFSNLNCSDTSCLPGFLPYSAVWYTPQILNGHPDVILPSNALLLDVETIRYWAYRNRGGLQYWDPGTGYSIGAAIFKVRETAPSGDSEVVGDKITWKLQTSAFWIESVCSGYPYIADDNLVLSRYDVPATLVRKGIIRVLGASAFIRGDSNDDGKVDLSDAVNTLNALFLGTGRVRCEDAGDANDDGKLDIGDAIFTLNYLFVGGKNPPAPFPSAGSDPTEDDLRC